VQVGRLWTSLADYYIRQGMYESARDVYEEGLTTVITVRDFSLIFDTLTQFEETLITHRMSQLDEDDAEEPEQVDGQSDGEDFLLKDDQNDIDLRCVAPLFDTSWDFIVLIARNLRRDCVLGMSSRAQDLVRGLVPHPYSDAQAGKAETCERVAA
jgi:pentatricopeptide repeat protein